MSKALFTVIGYVVFSLYTCGIMYLGDLIERKTGADKTICRKMTHIVSAFVWVICYYFFGCSIHWVLLNGIGAAILGVVTYTGFMKGFERDDASKSYGLFYFGLSTFVVALVTYIVGERLYLYTGIAYYCLALGDGFAPITAKLCGKHNVQIMKGKSLVGSLTVFVVSFLATFVFGKIFDMKLSLLFVASVAALTCVTEFYGVKGLDNIFIEFAVFGYLVMYEFGLVSVTMQVVVLLTPFLAMAAIGSKSLSVSGGVSALVLFVVTAAFDNGSFAVVYMATLFGVATAISLVTGKLYKKSRNVCKNSLQNGVENAQTEVQNEQNDDVSSDDNFPCECCDQLVAKAADVVKPMRNAKQVLAVGLIAVCFLVAYRFTQISLFIYLYALTLAEQFADSVASDVGRLTKGKNYNILGFKQIAKGLSGGVSLLGTLCALVASFALPLVAVAYGVLDWVAYGFVGGLAFVGTIVDSVLGAAVQSLYVCNNCGEQTEVPVHCGISARLTKGIAVVDNTAVNFITSAITSLLGLLLLLL